MKNTFRKIALMLLMSTAMLTAAGQSRRDVKFAQCAAKDGLMEVKLAELALDKAKTAEVRNHAKHMINDHSKANTELKKIASKKGIVLASSMTERQQKHYNKFASMETAKFDKKYAKQMKCEHKKALWMFKKEAKRGDDTELTSWAANKVPALKGHLEMWEDVCKNLKNDNSGTITSK